MNPYASKLDAVLRFLAALDALVPNKAVQIIKLHQCPTSTNRHIFRQSQQFLHLILLKIIPTRRKWQTPLTTQPVSSLLRPYHLVPGSALVLHIKR